MLDSIETLKTGYGYGTCDESSIWDAAFNDFSAENPPLQLGTFFRDDGQGDGTHDNRNYKHR